MVKQLQAGRSLEQIGRLAGRHPSTVAYWLRKHGLTAAGASRYAARGGLARETLEAMVAEGLTLREMAARADRSVATVRHWLERWGIEREPPRSPRTPANPADAPRSAPFECPRHGLTAFVLEGRGSYRCKRCRQERVAEWRRRTKRMLVAEAGGVCRACGYGDCVAALQFHHLDPASKRFSLSHKGLARGLDQVRAEAAKCVLLCATCHAEVEAGFRTLAVDESTLNSPGRIRTSKN